MKTVPGECRSCRFARFQRTPTGTIKADKCGDCRFPIDTTTMPHPKCVTLLVERRAIWSDHGGCQVWERQT